MYPILAAKRGIRQGSQHAATGCRLKDAADAKQKTSGNYCVIIATGVAINMLTAGSSFRMLAR
jgi:hypothetical protein